MYIPSQKQFQTVIDNLEKATQIANNNLGKFNCKMFESKVFNDCGTPMCHAGWYAVTLKTNTYNSGAFLMAEHLGFSHPKNLIKWAEAAPNFWGNEYGGWIFSSGIAFSIDSDVFDLQLIVDHWKGVKERALKFTLQLEE